MKVKVRALTFYVPVDWRSGNLKEALEESFIRVSELSKVVKNGLKYEVWTVRVALPPTPPNINGEHLAEITDELASTYSLTYVATLHYHVDYTPKIENVIEYVLGNTERVFISLYGEALSFKSQARTLASMLNRLSGSINEYERFARIGFVMNGPIKTPYFPGSVNVDNDWGFAISLLYPKYLLEGLNSGVTLERTMVNIASKIEEEISSLNIKDIKYHGVDLSISPWMEESVVELIEEYGGLQNLKSPRTLHTIYEVNREIELARKSVRNLGFNEVMLAVAEDSKAKEEVKSGTLDLNTLLSLSQVCMNGIDMVAVHNDFTVEALLLDSSVIAHIKGKPFGFRAIPVCGEEEIDMGRFGKVPVMSYFSKL